MNQQIPLEIHHINGVYNDNRLENLQLLCPNCHAQTDNYCGKNIAICKNKLIENKETKLKKYKYSELFSKEFIEQKINESSVNSFESLAKELTIAPKTLKNLCKKYNLPSSKTEMGLHKHSLKNSKFCLYCNKEFKPKRSETKFCSKICFRKFNNIPEYKEISIEDILRESHNYNSMSTLASYFGLKDIRGWCKKYKLPKSIQELRKYKIE